MHTLRIGGEVSVSEHFLLRAGYNYLSSPYKKGINDGSAHVASAGLGFRFSRFFFDLAYSLRLSQEKYWIYNANLVNAADINLTKHRVSATFGVKL
jgi:long-subunit fatty acid transport protein